MTDEPPTFGALLSRYRTAALLTQEQLAERAGLSARGVSDLERGIKGRPRAYTVRQLSDALRLSPDDKAAFEQAASAVGADARPDGATPEGNFLGALPIGSLVARQEEVERLGLILDAVRDGAGHLLLLGGEMGAGKTRLLQHLMVEARQRTMEVLTGRCRSAERATPFYPVLAALSGLDTRARDARHEWQKVQELVSAYAADRPAEPGVAQHPVLNVVSDLLLLLARAHPLAVLLDDLHWADTDTLSLLQHLAHTTRSSPILLAGSFRDVRLGEERPELAALLSDLSRERLVERITVRRLSLEETTELIAATMGRPEVSEDFASFVYRRTKGNPRLIDQLVRSLGGRLELQGEIGAGSTGRVFRAFDRTLRRVVAAKLVLARTPIELDGLMRFQQEGAVLARLDHPNIVRIHDTFAEEHATCIIMELLDGQALGRILQDGPLPLARARHLGLQVADALAYAHTQSIVHRDVKPDNVMVLPGDRVKVMDFGIARIVQPDRSLQTMATTGMRMGTPLYMAPEQIEGKEVDGRTDIYALGAMLYHMVTGRPPFDDSDVLAIVVKQLQEEPVPPSDRDPAIPADWDEVILRALAKDPNRRFASVKEMREAIAGLSKEAASPAGVVARTQQLSATRDPVIDTHTPTGRRARSRRLAVGSALGALALAGGLMVYRDWPGRQEPGMTARLVASWQIPAGPVFTPTGIAVNGQRVYVTDSRRDRVVEFSPTGRFIASWGSSGSGPGELREPQGMALDALGHIYVADTGNDRIEKFSSKGRFLESFGRRGTQRGQFRSPEGVTVGSDGTIYVADTGNSRVQALTPEGSPLSNWDPAGTQRGKMVRPNDVAILWSSQLAVTDPAAGQVPTLDAGDGSFQFYAVSIPPPDFVTPMATVGFPAYYVLDTGLQSILKYGTNGRVVQTWHGHFRSARGLAVDGKGYLYVADTGDGRILKFAPTGALVASWNGASLAPHSAPSPRALAPDARGNLYVADAHENQIVVLSSTGHVLKHLTGSRSHGPLKQPSGVAVDARSHVYVADTLNNRIVRFSAAGTVDAVWAPTGIFPGPFNHPHAVRVDAYGRVYVADTDNNRVERLKPNGEDSKVWYIPVIPPKPGIHNFPDPFCNQVYQCGQWTGMAIDRRGQIYVTDTQHNLVFKLSPLGVVRDKFGGSGSQPGRFHNPEGIAVSSSGTIYVADTGNRRVQIFSPSGKLIGTIQQGLDAPADVLITRSRGAASTLYVADSGSGRVLQFSVAS